MTDTDIEPHIAETEIITKALNGMVHFVTKDDFAEHQGTLCALVDKLEAEVGKMRDAFRDSATGDKETLT